MTGRIEFFSFLCFYSGRLSNFQDADSEVVKARFCPARDTILWVVGPFLRRLNSRNYWELGALTLTLSREEARERGKRSCVCFKVRECSECSPHCGCPGWRN